MPTAGYSVFLYGFKDQCTRSKFGFAGAAASSQCIARSETSTASCETHANSVSEWRISVKQFHPRTHSDCANGDTGTASLPQLASGA